MCTIHGPGAKRHWRPVWKKVVGPEGRVTHEYSRVTYYTCDLGPGGRTVGQTRLSFVKTTLPENSKKDDTDQGDLGDDPPTGGN